MTLDEQTYSLHGAHSEAIALAGGIPLIIPYVEQSTDIKQLVSLVHGLYLTGGHDIDPHLFYEEPYHELGVVEPLRDTFEINIINKTLSQRKPIFGVCRGCQILNVAFGGSMIQDIKTQVDRKTIQHIQKRPLTYASHTITITHDSLPFDILSTSHLTVNSYHHQANDRLGEHVIASAYSPDAIIEAIEHTDYPFVLGVQWHPERLLHRETKEKNESKLMFERFIHEAKKMM